MINTGLVDGAEVLQLGQKIKKEVGCNLSSLTSTDRGVTCDY